MHLSRTLTAAVLIAAGLSACTTAGPTELTAPTTSRSAAPSVTASPTTSAQPSSSTTSSPTPAVATDPHAMAGDPLKIGSADLKGSARAYAAAVSNRSWINVVTLSCPGLQPGTDPDGVEQALEDATPRMSLTVDKVAKGRLGAEAEAELVDPGLDVDDYATVVFAVGEGSEYPNPTMTARYVHNPETGWLYCGMAPNA